MLSLPLSLPASFPSSLPEERTSEGMRLTRGDCVTQDRAIRTPELVLLMLSFGCYIFITSIWILSLSLSLSCLLSSVREKEPREGECVVLLSVFVRMSFQTKERRRMESKINGTIQSSPVIN